MDNQELYKDYGLNIPEVTSNTKRIVVIGGGFGGINLIKKLPKDKFQIVLFDKHNYHTFVPLLYQVATCALEAPSIADATRGMFHKRSDVFFRSIKVLQIDADAQEVKTQLGNLYYDYLVIATGSKPNFFGNRNIEKYAFPLKTLPQAVAIRSRVLQNLEKATFSTSEEEKKRFMSFVIVGGGPTGVEVAGAIAELRRCILPKDYKDLNFKMMKIKIVEGNERLLKSMTEKASDNALKTLKKMGVEIHFHTLVSDFDGKTISYKNNDDREPCGMLIWGAGVSGILIEGLKEESTAHNLYKVDGHCLINGYTNIFAIGDVAWFQDERYEKGLPGVAQTAIQQGAYLAKMLEKITKDTETKTLEEKIFRYGRFQYKDKGSLATIGKNKAVADLPKNIHLSGFPAWFIWVGVHLYALNSLRNRLTTFLSWSLNYFKYENKVRLIITPNIEEGNIREKEFMSTNETGI